MALQPDIQYVPFYYVDGSTARKAEPKPVKKTSAAPARRARRAKRKTIAIDPVAIGGVAIAMVMLIMMLVGFIQYSICQEQTRQMQEYVASLQMENAQLQQDLDSNIDLEYVREVAEAMGMVPAQDAQQIQISVQLPQQEHTEMTLWESITTFLAGLFA